MIVSVAVFLLAVLLEEDTGGGGGGRVAMEGAVLPESASTGAAISASRAYRGSKVPVGPPVLYNFEDDSSI